MVSQQKGVMGMRLLCRMELQRKTHKMKVEHHNQNNVSGVTMCWEEFPSMGRWRGEEGIDKS